jgi:hypothetical protein
MWFRFAMLFISLKFEKQNAMALNVLRSGLLVNCVEHGIPVVVLAEARRLNTTRISAKLSRAAHGWRHDILVGPQNDHRQ